MKIFKLFIISCLVLIFSIFINKPSYAVQCNGTDSHIHFCHSNSGGVVWGIAAKFIGATGKTLSWHTYNAHNPNNYNGSCNGTAYMYLKNYRITTRDKVQWYSSCVDPTDYTSPNGTGIQCANGESPYIWNANIDVTCYANQTGTVKYRGCGDANRLGNTYVGPDAKCPANTSNDCVKGGYVDACSDGKSVCNSNCTRTTYNCNYAYSGSSMCRTNTDKDNRTCVNNGSCDCTKNSDCSGNKTCISNNCVNRYGCQSNGQCVKQVGGNYTTSNCNNKCGPVDECQTNANCNDNKVCGTGGNSCVRYGTICQSVGTGAQKHNECVKNTNDVLNQNSAACGTDCPVGPTNLSSSASCDSNNKAAITLNWNHIPYEDNYDLYYKKHSVATFNRIGKIDPKASGANTYTIENLPFNTQYDWYVIGHTTGTHDDPTVKSATAHITTGAQNACLGNLTINTYVDYDGNGVQDPTDAVAKNITYDVSIPSNADFAGGNTGNAGSVTLTKLASNNYTIRISGYPAGWTLTNNNPQTKAVVPPTNQVANFGIQPPAPTCTGGLTANPTLVHPGVTDQDTSRLLAVGCKTPDNRTPDFNWPTPDKGTTVNVNQPNTSWSIESSYNALNTSAHPTVSVCNPGSTTCKSYEAEIAIVPYFRISGNAFVDNNKDGYKNNADTNYTAGQTRLNLYSGSSLPDQSVSPLKTIANNNGAFNFTGLNPGTYTIAYASKPPSYLMTYPKVDGTPNLTVTVGTGQCVTNDGRNPGTASWKTQCAAGNISNLNFGINGNVAWIQTGGGDGWWGGGFTNPIPAGATCTEPDGTNHGAYASIRINGTPGVIYSGNATPDFGAGSASLQNWQVGDIPGVGKYPEEYTPSNGVIKTSYNFLLAAATKNNITINNLATYCTGGLNNCDLPNTAAGFLNGIYRAEGDLHITANTTFPAGKNYVILVHGDLYIENEIHVPTGSTVIFSAGPRNTGNGGNIIIDKSVGINQANVYDNFQVEGWYSADRNFTIDGENNCPAKDYRLNMAGAIVVNAGLNGGSLVNNRDRCGDDANCPVFYIQERPDFTLNAPTFLQVAPRIWREVAP